jgi:hypothetical protein
MEGALNDFLEKYLGKSRESLAFQRKSGEYAFINVSELLTIFLTLFYPNKVVVVLFDCKEWVEFIPKLQVLKRDKWTAYHWAKNNEIAIIEFGSIVQAEDWVFSISNKIPAKFNLYDNVRLVRNEKGKVQWEKEAENEKEQALNGKSQNE